VAAKGSSLAEPTPRGIGTGGLALSEASALPAGDVLSRLSSATGGLSAAEAARRFAEVGPNLLNTHRIRAVTVLAAQFRNWLLLLLLLTALVSAFLGQQTNAGIIVAILALSVGLGFTNEYRAERTAAALHAQVRQTVPTLRAGGWTDVDVTELVPGDVVRLELGMIIPADLRLLETDNLACDEAVLTGEAEPVEKSAEPVTANLPVADLASCALMGTTVRQGRGQGVVVATGGRTVFGSIARDLSSRPPETAFQTGLRRFSGLLAKVAAVLTGSIFIVNLLLHRAVIDALLFSLAIAVGVTPQLLPAVVTTSLAIGSRRLARRHVLVKRLTGIEDLGNIEVLFTDKTGTLTEGRVAFRCAIDSHGTPAVEVLRLGLLCNEASPGPTGAVGGNPLDRALWETRDATDLGVEAVDRIALLPFDHERRMTSVLVHDERSGQLLVTKGAPETILDRCSVTPTEARTVLQAELATGSRVIAVAARPAPDLARLSPADEHGLTLVGFLTFTDPPKATASSSLARLDRLGVELRLVTGDHPLVAEKVCAELEVASKGTLTGADVAALDDEALARAVGTTTIFARVSPEQKGRIIRVQREAGRDVGFLGDGVNDVLALHEADVGISVDSAVDVAKDAADVVLLEKDLALLTGGVVEGRRIFSNTMKYVLMGTSSNFGNMFSAAGASAFLTFLPMLPSQILLNNLLYDAGEMTIPTDHVDDDQLQRPSHWDIGLIEHFMLVFGPVSSLFDFATFALMLGVFNAGEATFRSGWFVESICTQTLVIFVIRTRRVPFFQSHPSRPLLGATLATVGVGILLPISPLAGVLGFGPLSPAFYGALLVMVVTYLALVELTKQRVFRWPGQPRPLATPRPEREGRIHRRAFRWSHVQPPGGGRSRA
jgi:Mg2+-importing ATPase